MDSPIEVKIKRIEIESQQNWGDKKNRTVPLKFHSDWDVQIIPPFGGAMARFFVSYQDRSVSVYYDINNSLGMEKEPYYELYGETKHNITRVLTGKLTDEEISRKIFFILNDMLGDDKVYPEPESLKKPEPPPAEVFEPCKHCGSTTVECLWDKQDDPPCG